MGNVCGFAWSGKNVFRHVMSPSWGSYKQRNRVIQCADSQGVAAIKVVF